MYGVNYNVWISHVSNYLDIFEPKDPYVMLSTIC